MCFLLPFATVSCEGAETTFSGAQLATWSVPEGGTLGETDIGTQVEDEASALAAIALAAVVLGIVIGALRLPWGEGCCACAGLVLMLVLALKAANSMATTLHGGYGTVLLLFIWAAVLHARRAWIDRRPPAPT